MSETTELDVITTDPSLVSPALYEIRNVGLEAGGLARIMLDEVVPYFPSDAGAQIYGLRAPAAVEILVVDERWYVVQVARQGGAENGEYIEAYPHGINGPCVRLGYNVGWLLLRPEVFMEGLGQRDGIRGALSLRPGSTIEVGGANPKYVERFPGTRATDRHAFSVRLSSEGGPQTLDIIAGISARVLSVKTIGEFSLANTVGDDGAVRVAHEENVALTEIDRQQTARGTYPTGSVCNVGGSG